MKKTEKILREAVLRRHNGRFAYQMADATGMRRT
jgi:hypothetical protein